MLNLIIEDFELNIVYSLGTERSDAVSDPVVIGGNGGAGALRYRLVSSFFTL